MVRIVSVMIFLLAALVAQSSAYLKLVDSMTHPITQAGSNLGEAVGNYVADLFPLTDKGSFLARIPVAMPKTFKVMLKSVNIISFHEKNAAHVQMQVVTHDDNCAD